VLMLDSIISTARFPYRETSPSVLVDCLLHQVIILN
ncbi:unnamed protein product, partial [Didymodactylos carnosus]